VIPGLVIFLTSLSFNLFGVWLRSVSDPLQRWCWLNRLKSPRKPASLSNNGFIYSGSSLATEANAPWPICFVFMCRIAMAVLYALRIPACLTNIRIFVEYHYFNIGF